MTLEIFAYAAGQTYSRHSNPQSNKPADTERLERCDFNDLYFAF